MPSSNLLSAGGFSSHYLPAHEYQGGLWLASSVKSKQPERVFKTKKDLPNVSAVDKTARIQTVNKRQHRRMYNLLERLRVINEYPLVINTSFNFRYE